MPSARELEMIVTALEPLVGPRTVWLDPYGRLWHSTPDPAQAGIPHRQWRAVGTFEHPSAEALAAAISAVVGAPMAVAC
jgi:hypothetical protein